MADLEPANENQWYVLMTLYGEQEGAEVDEELHRRNRAAWNAWACQALPEDERERLIAKGFELPESVSWKNRQEEIKKLHNEEMTRRNDAGFSYPEFPDSTVEIDMRVLRFDLPFVAEKILFPKTVRLQRAGFDREATFCNALFVGAAVFTEAVFREKAIFENAIFENRALFASIRFEEEALFQWAAFSDKAVFRNAIFGSNAGFQNTNFRCFVDFASAEFSENATFFDCKFMGSVSFHRVGFHGFAYFQEAKFGTQGNHAVIDFSQSQFLHSAGFYHAHFYGSYPEFSGAELSDFMDFSAEPAHWPTVVPEPKDAKVSCGVIRHAMGRQGKPEEEHFFFRREMGFATQIGGVWQRLPYCLFRSFSDFGYSIERPVSWLFWLWLVVGIFAFFLPSPALRNCWHDWIVLVRSLALSFSNIFNFLGLTKTYFDVAKDIPAGWQQLLAGIQSVAGVVFLFFLGLGLRTRFRLR